VNQGYGGNQKLGYRYAIDQGFDVVALLHGDAQYPPEILPDLVAPIAAGDAGACFGSRMMVPRDALRGGMPLYKYVGNKILTQLQNRMLSSNLSEFHSGFRAYAVRALEQIPFERNTNDFHFDTEIIIQLLRAGFHIHEIPIPTHYGDEVCHVDGMKYAGDVMKATLLSRAQDFGVLYDRKYDIRPPESPYESKAHFPSSHSLAIGAVRHRDKVLDLGCGPAFVAEEIRRQKSAHVTAMDRRGPKHHEVLKRVDRFIEHDLDAPDLPAELDDDYDVILLLDVIEHLSSPERFLDTLRRRLGHARPRIVLTTGNVAFLPVRAGLALGQLNYGPRGILDLTHTRLFTFGTLLRLLEQSGFEVKDVRGVPAPFPLALGDNAVSRALVGLNQAANAVSRSLFAYQMYVEAVMAPTVEALLGETIRAEDPDRVVKLR
jgi:2-polyprenyl-3-methyl-5-hydroxy-6-metoxy-1,4-benzoquinol methylase